MNNFLNEYFGFHFELNNFLAGFKEKMNIHNVSARAIPELSVEISFTLYSLINLSGQPNRSA